MLQGSGGFVRCHRECPLLGDLRAQTIGIVGGVGHDRLGWEPLDQRERLRCVATLAGGQEEPHGTAQASDRHVDLGAQAAARTSNGRTFRPPFLAQAACWWARPMVESQIRYSKYGYSANASKIRNKTP